jgi:hypothetical protein
LGHPFTYTGPLQHVYLTGGSIGSLSTDINGSIAYKFTGLAVPFLFFLNNSSRHHMNTAQLDLLLPPNSSIIGSPHNDLLVGGLQNNNFVFNGKLFGHDAIINFNGNYDKIVLPHKIFHNFAEIEARSHLNRHGDVVIKADASDTITLDTVHHVGGLTSSDFLFF